MKTPGERNFHIFYQLLTGADIQFLSTIYFLISTQLIFNVFLFIRHSESLKLQRNVDKYEILNHGSSSDDDRHNFTYTKVCSSCFISSIEYYNLTFLNLQKSLETLGLNAEEIQSIFKIIAIVIKLGNLIFVPMTNIDGTEGCQVSNEYGSKNYYYWKKYSFSLNCLIELMEIAQLLQIDPQILVSCLTRAESNWIQMDNGPELNAASATHTTLSLCRTLYGRLFTWIVGRINDSLKVYSFFSFLN